MPSFQNPTSGSYSVTLPSGVTKVYIFSGRTSTSTNGTVVASATCAPVAPTVTSLGTTSGPAAGGTTVVITGTSFTGATSVKFGAASASFTVNSDTQITATSPAGSGTVHVTVTNSTGTSATSSADQFTYTTSGPTVTSVSPFNGPTAGGTGVIITGTKFTGATSVKFGSTAATFTVLDDNNISATSPAHAAGSVNISVTTPGGTGTGNGLFTYGGPLLTTETGLYSGVSGGATIEIDGTDLGSATVTINGVNATITTNTSTKIIFTTPPNPIGDYFINVTTPGGSDSSTFDVIYIGAITIDASFSPNSVAVGGTSTLTFTLAKPSNFGYTSTSFATALPSGLAVAAAPNLVNNCSGTTVTATAGSSSISGSRASWVGAAGSCTFSVDVTVSTPGNKTVVPGNPTPPSATVGGSSIPAVAGSPTTLQVPGPAVTSVSPASGPIAGGTSVVITGAGFSSVTAVTFGATAATSFTVNSATQITATAPAGSAGVVDITVTTSSGTSSTSSADQFTYAAAPTVSSVSPASGTTAGSTGVTITGTNLSNATAVKFGSTNATSFTVNSSTQITATSPVGGAGAVDVTVTTPGGTSAASSSDQFTYVGPPTVTSVSPSSGTTAGGTSVTITGTNFTGATAVKFGSTNAASFTFNSATQITASSPAGSGTVDVTVTTPIGTSTTSASDQFTYTTAPAVSSISPTTGPVAGGTSVTITGTNFTGVTAVKFGSTNAASFSFVSATQITATSPAGSAGAVDITVTTPAGTSATSAGDQFTYVAAPTVTSVNPTAGSLAGGTVVTITGTNLTGATSVTFGGTAATNVIVNNATSITATTPAHSAGTVDVAVTTIGGTGTGSGLYTYAAAPTVTSANPSGGPTAGGTSVTLTGTNFTGATAVTFGGTAASGFTVNSATSITVTAPAHAAGSVDVVVTTPGGTGTGIYTYAGVSTVTSANPSSGPTAGGNTVILTGTNFTGATAVTFGGTAATGFTVNSATSITVTAPAHAAGAVDVTVTTPGGAGVGSGIYTYAAPPTVTSANPNAGPIGGGASVTLTGTNFTGTTAVTFGGTPASGFTVNSATSITVTTPAHAAGAVDVVVTTPGGVGTGSGIYTYAGIPAVTSVSPSSGPVAGGTSVTVTGSNFTGTTAVKFGSTAAASFTVNSATSITATSPAGTGTVDITVTTPGGTSGTGSSDQFTYAAIPAVSSLNPNHGPVAGGTSVVITGTNLTGASAVQFGSTAASSFAVNSATQITATSPAGTGTVDVIVTTPGGQSGTAAGSKYTYIGGPTTTGLTSSLNPSQYGQAVTFTATITGPGGTPTGTVTFKDGGTVLSTVSLAGGSATYTTSSLTVGTHPITATYSGDANFPASSSSMLNQAVNVPTDSLHLRQMQVLVTPQAANTFGQMITGAIDEAISSGFSESPSPFVSNGNGFTANLFVEPNGQQTVAAARDNGLSDFLGNPAQRGFNRRVNDGFSALGYARETMPTKAAAAGQPAVTRDWLAWIDFRGMSVARYSSSDDLKGNQVTLLLGLTRKLSPSVIVGGFGGYEYFKYTSDALNSQLKGDGWTLGAYFGWRITSTVHIDVAAARSQVDFGAAAGTASATFPGHRWLVSGGVTGDYKWQGFALQPSARIYGLWEHEDGYTDSLGISQPDRNFETGRASTGMKVGYPMLWDAGGFTPYVGLYGDYYFTRDDANAIGAETVPLLQGWSAHATGGLSIAVNKGMSADLAAEYGGIGSNTHIWSYRGRLNVPF